MLCARGRLVIELASMKFERPFPFLTTSELHRTLDISAAKCHIDNIIVDVDGNLAYHWYNIPWNTTFRALLQQFSFASQPYQIEDLFKNIRSHVANLHLPTTRHEKRFTFGVQLDLEILKESKSYHFESPQLIFTHRCGLDSTWLELGNQEDVDVMLTKSKELAVCPVLILVSALCCILYSDFY